MKKLIFATLVAMSATAVFAQNPGPVQARFQQTAQLSADALAGSIGAEYIAGYRFNPHLFVGAGTGVNLLLADKGAAELRTTENTELAMHMLNIPLFVNVKGYLFKESAWNPFISLSAGGHFSTNGTARMIMGEVKYNTCGVLADAALGVEYRLSQNRSVHISVGAGINGIPYAENITSYSFDNVQKYKLAVNITAGFTF